MTSDTGPQMDFLAPSTALVPRGTDGVRFAIRIGHMNWLRFLNDEWLLPDSSGRITLGVNHPYPGEMEPNPLTVTAWIDPTKLPNSPVLVLRSRDRWESTTLGSTSPNDEIVSWPGPIPLFAIDRFSADTEQALAHLTALARSFDDISQLTQRLVVAPTEVEVGPAPAAPEAPWQAPAQWDRLRGAAAMAFWAVPSIQPWLDLLRQLFSSDTASDHKPDGTNAPWLQPSPWAETVNSEMDRPLWTAILIEARNASLETTRAPAGLLHSIVGRAESLGEDRETLRALVQSSDLLLRDAGPIAEFGLKTDFLGLALQLALLRPTPERFSAWREDWTAIPPAAWWTGAIIVGFFAGFRALPLQMRGNAEARKFVAIRTWHLSGNPGGNEWNALLPEPLSIALDRDQFTVAAGSMVLAQNRMSARGLWYASNFSDPGVRDEAALLISKYFPALIRRRLLLNPGKFDVTQAGELSFDREARHLIVNAPVEILATDAISMFDDFDPSAFQTLLSTAGIPHKLPRPALSQAARGQIVTRDRIAEASAKLPNLATPSTTGTSLTSGGLPNGLQIFPEFVDVDEERSLIHAIDLEAWDSSMSRRVQHYGWRYDYKAKRVAPTDFLGPLPLWAEQIADRLVRDGLLVEQPDQVIVNEYVGAQGIAKHVDCPECFRGPVVTLSLLETWQMIFSRKGPDGSLQKAIVALPMRSVAILDGEARREWAHEIPKRKTEGRVPRGRRISVTFRKVALNR